MKSSRSCSLAFALLLPLLPGSAVAPRCHAQDAPATESDTSFRPLFDGQSLDGWLAEDGRWSVENGVIVGTIPPGETLDHNTWLIWNGGEVADFELRLKFRISGASGANSGIQFRCQAEGVRHVAGYQADLDRGPTWLGRIYDEHGRALLVERGTRVKISEDGQRHVERFADPALFTTLFRDHAWNDYRIVACGEHVSVEINGTLFSELQDMQKGERDLAGKLALQLHSGGETLAQFRDIRLKSLTPGSHEIAFKDQDAAANDAAKDGGNTGVVPVDDQGRALNLSFEDGTLRDWTAEGDAFRGQPVDASGIARRWPGQSSNKDGRYFIGGYEIVKDGGTGSLTSAPFRVTHPFAALRFGGGSADSTRAEVVLESGEVLFTARGGDAEQMEVFAVDLRRHLDQRIFVRVIDASTGAWGHLNFDDFRFYDALPENIDGSRPARLRENPILSHLVSNPLARSSSDDPVSAAASTVDQMWLEPGFTAELVAGEPRLTQPIAFTFDVRGRIWIAEAHSYPQKRPEGEGLDRIVVLEDADGDGAFESRKVFAEGLNLVSGIEVGHGGVWIGAAPELLFIPDADGDDAPDGEPVVLLDGFGAQDTHETLNSFCWGPDGWLYGNQGVFNESHIGKPGTASDQREQLFAGVWRYHPTRHVFEVFAHGGSNQWGLDFDDHGQLFMTHCRSHHGRGATTHVIQGGHYWNQSNSNHADFIWPEVQNFLLASAPYGHGEGGAGKRGSRRIYGGHSHVGTLIYLGDNWPRRFRNHLFTLNLHGHQINHQVNRRLGSGFETLHAGRDVFYCPDPRFIGVDLQCGPDGAVYIIDWADRQHCHNPNEEQWDRSNGRLYRMAYAATWKPAAAGLNLAALPDAELIELQSHANDWFTRAARRLLRERAATGSLDAETVGRLREKLLSDSPAVAPRLRLRYLWALHAVDGLTDSVASVLLTDADDFVRAWTIQLIAEDGDVSGPLAAGLRDVAELGRSATVRMYLAAATQRLRDRELAWGIVEQLAMHGEDQNDPNIPKMLWFSLAELSRENTGRALALAERGDLPQLRNFAFWYAAKPGGGREGLELLIARMEGANADTRRFILEKMSAALSRERAVFDAPPGSWAEISPALYADADRATRRMAEGIGVVLGDKSRIASWLATLADREQPKAERGHAFRMLGKASNLGGESAPIFVGLLDDADFRSKAIRSLRAFSDQAIATALIEKFAAFSAEDQALVVETLISRPAFAAALLDAVKDGTLKREVLTAHHARQVASLGNSDIVIKLEDVWGKINATPEAVAGEIEQLRRMHAEAPLWAFSSQAGRAHFQRLCVSCHQANDEGGLIGPDLTGSGGNGASYFLENIIDPNAVVGADFQISLITTADGQTLAGMIERETASALTLRTVTESVVIANDQITDKQTLAQSLMPPGLLQTLSDREKIELLKFLTGL